jgi:hypothetical protein
MVAKASAKNRVVAMDSKLVSIIFLVPSIAIADTASKVTLVDSPFKDELRTGAKISGARLVGAISAPLTSPAGNQVQVSAFVPDQWGGQSFCLSVVSADGLYESRNTYAVPPDWTGGKSEIDYPTRYAREALSYPGAQIAGLISLGDCATAGSEVSPVYWNSGAQFPIRLLFNTSRSEETFLSFPGLPDQEDIVCAPIDADLRNAFDTVCLLPPSSVLHGGIEIVAVSFKNGEMGPEESFKLNLGNDN